MKARTRTAALGLIAAATLTACGSTVSGVPTGGTTTAVDSGGLGISDPASTPDTASSSASPESVSPEQTFVALDPSESPDSGAEGASPSQVPNASSGAVRFVGRGVTKDTVSIGYAASDGNDGAAIAALGLKGVGSVGDLKAQMQAVINDIMRRGGLDGRRIVLIPHVYDTNEVLTDPNTAAEKACADMTEDHKIFVMIQPAVSNEVAQKCFAKKGVPIVYGLGLENPRSFASKYKRYPTYINVGGMLGDRFQALAMGRLAKRGFFEKWNTVQGEPGGAAPVKVGVLVKDNPDGAEQLASITKELAKNGIKVADTFRSSEGLAASISEQQGAMLRFRSAGITHVIGSGVTFQTAAESQGYRPRYFVDVAVTVVASTSPRRQMSGAMAESFVPAQDTDAANDPGLPTAATAHCLKLMKAAGQPYSDRTTLWAMQGVCDTFFLVENAVRASKGDLSTAGFIKGVESLGTSMQTALTWSAFFGPGEHASARSVRDMSFQNACRCFVYVSKQNWSDLGS